MPKIVPEITNGIRRLVLSETFLMQPSEGLVVAIPLMPGPAGVPPKLNLQLKFPNDTGDIRHVFEATGQESIQLTLFNALKGSFMGGTIKPFGFSVGDLHFHLFLSLVCISDQVGQITLTIYQD